MTYLGKVNYESHFDDVSDRADWEECPDWYKARWIHSAEAVAAEVRKEPQPVIDDLDERMHNQALGRDAERARIVAKLRELEKSHRYDQKHYERKGQLDYSVAYGRAANRLTRLIDELEES